MAIDKKKSLPEIVLEVTTPEADDLFYMSEKINPAGGDSPENFRDAKIKSSNMPGGAPSPGADTTAVHVDVADEIDGITEKITPVAADLLIIEDSEAAGVKKKIQITNLPGGGGTDADAIHDNVAGEIDLITEKVAPVGADLLIIEDSEDSNNKKKVQLDNLPGGSGGGSSTPSQIHLNTYAGLGSGPAIQVSTWTNTIKDIGTDLTLNKDAVNGDSMTVNTAGFYTVMLERVPSGVATISLSLNASDLTVVTDALPIAERLLLEVNNASSYCPLSLTRYFEAGDIIRHQDGAASVLAAGEFLRMEGPISGGSGSGGGTVNTPMETFTPVLTGCGTTTLELGRSRRVSDCMEAEGSFKCGVSTGDIFKLAVPHGELLDLTKISGGIQNSLGYATRIDSTSSYSTREAILFSDGVDDTSLFVSIAAASDAVMAKSTGSNFIDNLEGCTFNFTIPIAGWTVGGGSGSSSEYILLEDQKSSGVNGGTGVTGSWQTRVLNTEVEDTGNNCTLAANAFTLDAGTYEIQSSSPFLKTNGTQTRLQNTSDATTTLTGSSCFPFSGDDTQVESFLRGRFTIASAKTFEIQYRITVTSTGSDLGQSASFGTELYTQVVLHKIA